MVKGVDSPPGPEPREAPRHEGLRERLRDARLLLVFTPDACGGADPRSVLEAALPHVDVVQVRPKAVGGAGREHAPCEARATYEWTLRVLDLVRAGPNRHVLVTVDDRVDVARALFDAGCAGVHLGQDDMSAAAARAFLGPDAIVGWSTHSAEQVAEVDEDVVDYLGFGPIHATDTKGYARGLGAEACWIASSGTSLPVFPIGGVTLENAVELARVGRAAVASAILAAPDPARAARDLRALLASADD